MKLTDARRKMAKVILLAFAIWLVLLCYVIWPDWSKYIVKFYWLYMIYVVLFPFAMMGCLLFWWRKEGTRK